jgi:hypothetical protein
MFNTLTTGNKEYFSIECSLISGRAMLSGGSQDSPVCPPGKKKYVADDNMEY